MKRAPPSGGRASAREAHVTGGPARRRTHAQGPLPPAGKGRGTGWDVAVRLIKVLFVCSGNICRSPTAEAVFRRHVVQVGLQDLILVDSAGTLDYHVGEPPDPRTLEAARRRSYDLSGLCARQIGRQDFLEFDHLLAMDRGHLAALRVASPPEHRRKIRLFLEYAPNRQEREVPDPYYGTAAGFELVLDLVEEASRGLLSSLQTELPRVSASD